jgi:5-methylcytosine-specific restriction endonuclease McrBC regulatory subunit McrC
MYREHKRRPLRTYAHRRAQEFSVDGDVDPVDLIVDNPDGFEQIVLELTSDNEDNAVLATAVTALLPEVRDAETRKQLLSMQRSLGPQRAARRATPRRLPSRDRHWQAAYDLAVQVLNGFGLGYTPEHLLAPGFILRTWRTWQALVESALESGMPSATVVGQRRYKLGERSSQALDVTPDVVIAEDDNRRLVVDAKYRTREGTTPAIDASDVYETLAFMEATGTRGAVLLYPRPSSSGLPRAVGASEAFETITVGSRRITGLLVELRGISGTDGYGQFVERLANAVSAYMP